MKPIKLLLISGFLGAGKTTLLSKLLKEQAQIRTGVIVNEFGSIGVDGKVIAANGIQLVEFNNGSIFCSCLKENFVRALKTFTQQPIDMLIIENSGMADPAGMNVILDGLSPYIQRQYEYLGSVCLVDGTSFLDYIQMLLPLKRQIETADFVLLNKTDLCGNETLSEIRTTITDINPNVKIYNTMFASIPYETLMGNLKNNSFQGESTNTPYNRPMVSICEADGDLPREKLLRFARELSPKVFRMKGFSKCGQGYWHVDCAGSSISVELAKNPEEITVSGTKLVVISEKGTGISEMLSKAWSDLLGTPLKLTEE